jgi:hypothetical protein
VGRWIEELASSRREEYVELIAYHYESASRPEDAELAWPADAARREEVRGRAVVALVDAGHAATATFAIDQALGFGGRALACARTDAERLAALELKAWAAHAAVRADEAWSYYLEALAVAERAGDTVATQRLRARATLLWARYHGALTGDGWKPRAVEIVQEGLEAIRDDAHASFELGAFLTGRAAYRFWNMAPRSKTDVRSDAERAVAIAREIGSQTLLSYALDGLYVQITQDGFCDSAGFAPRALEVGRSMEDRGEAHELLVTATIAMADAGRFDEAAAAGAEAALLAARLGPHRGLHAGSAQTSALLPPGRLPELREATAAAADLVVEEGTHTCFHGSMALAGQALSASETGDTEAAKRALDLFDATVSADAINAYRTIEILRPLVGAEGARRRAEQARAGDALRAGAPAEVYRHRLELQLSAIEREWGRLHELADRARKLAASACAPYLEWIADWAHAVELAAGGQSHEAVAMASSASAALEAYGERYLAARLLVDLLPLLDAEEAKRIAEGVIRRLEPMGARSSVAETEKWLSGV